MCDSGVSEPVEHDQPLEATAASELEIKRLSIHDSRKGKKEHMMTTPSIATPTDLPLSRVEYVQYTTELQMPDIMRLMKADLSEPYSVYTYRYFIHNWPHLCLLVIISNTGFILLVSIFCVCVCVCNVSLIVWL